MKLDTNDNLEMTVSDELRSTEELLLSAANYVPERPATYNFASLAMSRQERQRRLSMWGALVSGIACAFVFYALPRNVGSVSGMDRASIQVPFTPPSSTTDSQGAELVSDDASKFQMRQSPARPLQYVDQKRTAGSIDSLNSMPEVAWKTETVHRFESGLMTQMMVNDGKEADGTQIRRSVPVYIPLSGGELPQGNSPSGTAGDK